MFLVSMLLLLRFHMKRMEQGRGSSQTNFRIYRLNSYLRAFSLGRSYLRPRVLIDFKLYKGWPTDGSNWKGCIGEAVAAGWG